MLPKGDINSLPITALAFDPNNSEIVYAAAGAGMYKSEDGAKSWKYILSGISVGDLVLDPANGSTVYASGIVGKSGKIIKSVDGGTSWVDIYSEPSDSNTVLSITLARNNSSTILAGLNNGEIIRSTDAGRTWQTVKDLTNRVVDIEFDSSNIAYALAVQAGLYKSPDAGLSWIEVSSVLTEDNLFSSNNALPSVSAFNDLAIDPKQAGVVYLGTEEGLYRTVDSASNWSFLSLPVRNGALSVSSITVEPNNSNAVYASVASTIYKSVNGGLTWETKVLPTSSIIDSILINPSSSNIIYIGLR